MLVFYCRVTNHPSFSELKQYAFISICIHSSVGQKFGPGQAKFSVQVSRD